MEKHYIFVVLIIILCISSNATAGIVTHIQERQMPPQITHSITLVAVPDRSFEERTGLQTVQVKPSKSGSYYKDTGNTFMHPLIRRWDKDYDGKVSKSEYKGPSALFEKMDKNKDDFLDQDECTKTLGKGKKKW